MLHINILNNLADNHSLTIGSGNFSEIVVSSPKVEPRHAQLSRIGNLLFVKDLDTANGTFLNGNEIKGKKLVYFGDTVCLGDFELVIPEIEWMIERTFDLPRLLSVELPLAMSVIGATKVVDMGITNGKSKLTILDKISFHLSRGEFLGILGSSGSGKSTLIRSIAGLIELSEGSILLNNELVSAKNLRADQRIAYLPQDVVIHESLSSAISLEYIAKLKLPNTNFSQRQSLIHTVLSKVGLWNHRDTPIHRLSGGQRKRAALAGELLGDPQLILLDEATSGLDPATEQEMMDLFRSLANEGRIVICITHFPNRLHLCDQLLYLCQGKSVFFGNPTEFIRFFHIRNIEDVYARQSDSTAAEWQSKFKQSSHGIKAASRISSIIAEKGRTFLPPSRLGDGNEFFFRQTSDLVFRYCRIQLTDWKNLLLLFAQAPIIAVMVGITFGNIKVSFAEQHASDTKQVLFVLVLAMLWCSGTASAREIVKEMHIVRHETRFGLSLLPYLLSKFIVLGLIALTQAASLLLIVRFCTQITGSIDLQFLILGITALVGVTIGLLISSIVGTSERAMTILPVLLIAQAIFSGGLAQLNGWIRFAAMLFVPAYWSFDGLIAPLSTDLLNATYPGAPGHYQPPILISGGSVAFSATILAFQIAAFLIMTRIILRRQLDLPPVR